MGSQKDSNSDLLLSFFVKRPIGVTAEQARMLTAEETSAACGRKSEFLKAPKLHFFDLRSKEEKMIVLS